ncbi:MAG: ABC transporter ATP-binding protein, partial [Anaerolinea sp.]|nr:ABC transporter ATP-binding protein [Anaerolinea sp.]
MREAQLMVLDEPTSALDVMSEYEVFERFRQVIKGRSAILISHRLSTIKMAHKIYVLDKHTIAEVGSHDELMAQGGIYAKLFDTQSMYYR